MKSKVGNKLTSSNLFFFSLSPSPRSVFMQLSKLHQPIPVAGPCWGVVQLWLEQSAPAEADGAVALHSQLAQWCQQKGIQVTILGFVYLQISCMNCVKGVLENLSDILNCLISLSFFFKFNVFIEELELIKYMCRSQVYYFNAAKTWNIKNK